MWKRIIIVVLLVPVLYISVILIHGTIHDQQPEEVLPVEMFSEGSVSVIQDTILSFVIWNLGYAGLGQESDFFYEKGSLFSGRHMVRPPQEVSQKNWKGIQNQIKNTQTDFWLFQEVDVASKRSYFVNQMTGIQDLLPDQYASFASNYEVKRVPVPLFEPWNAYGKVKSGLGTFTRHQPTEAQRLQLPGNYSWPTRVFMLDRCAAIHRFPHANGKEVVVVNIHNSAFDDGSLKAQQTAFLRELLLEEYEKGNYVIAGGDWNQCPPFFPFDRFMPGRGAKYEQQNIDPEMMPGNWKWVYDPTVPTNRKVGDLFEKGHTFVTLIDFFLISPNIRVKRARGIDLNFQFSDHQPVWMQVELL